MTDSVVAIDIKPRHVSTARFIEGERPRIGVIDLPALEKGEQHIAGASAAAERNAQDIYDKVTSNGKPALVVLSKLIFSTGADQASNVGNGWKRGAKPAGDPSAARRALLWWEVARVFRNGGIPIAEISPMTAQQFTTSGQPQWGMAGFNATAAAVCRVWPGINRAKEHFAYYAVAQAAAGAFLLGWKTPFDVSEERLGYFRSRAVSLPPKLTVPASATEWNARHAQHNEQKGVSA